MNTDLIKYYRDRANEYEKIYLKPERQDDISAATVALTNKFAGRQLKEIACGTGFWTERIAQTALSIHATDLNETVLEIARRKNYGDCKVTFGIHDIFDSGTEKRNESTFGGFIWSHIDLQKLDLFLTAINSSVVPGGLVIFMDNNFVEGSSTPIAKTDHFGNTYQIRTLADATEHLVMKNFPAEKFLFEKLKGMGTDFEFISFKYYWLLSYKTLPDNASN